MTELSKHEIIQVVNSYIGVSNGYLGDFSYRTHAEFYAEFCDIDPKNYEGTIRERFIAILQRSEPFTQARILRGVLRKYPVGSSPARTQDQVAAIEALICRLEGDVEWPDRPPP
jgi:hypothetical protein